MEPDALHKFIYWERKHLNPYEIEDFLRKTFGWTPPLDYLMSHVPQSLQDEMHEYWIGMEQNTHKTMYKDEDLYHYGFYETAFKLQTREHPTCFNNGRYMFYSLILTS